MRLFQRSLVDALLVDIGASKVTIDYLDNMRFRGLYGDLASSKVKLGT